MKTLPLPLFLATCLPSTLQIVLLKNTVLSSQNTAASALIEMSLRKMFMWLKLGNKEVIIETYPVPHEDKLCEHLP